MIMISQNGFALTIVGVYLILKVLRLANFLEFRVINKVRKSFKGLILGESAKFDVKSGEYNYFNKKQNNDLYSREGTKALKHNYLFNEIIFTSFIIYLIFLISKIYFPISFSIGEEVIHRMPNIWLRPLWSLREVYEGGGIYGFIYQIGGNLILLAPLAFYMMYFKTKKFKRLKSVLALCLKVTICIETSQVLLSVLIPSVQRYFEINDIICNTLGGVIGFGLYKLFDYLLERYEVYIKRKQEII